MFDFMADVTELFRQRLDVAPEEAARHSINLDDHHDGLNGGRRFWCPCGWRHVVRIHELLTDHPGGLISSVLTLAVKEHNAAIGAPSLADLTDLGWFNPEPA